MSGQSSATANEADNLIKATIDQLLEDAINRGASAVHFEPRTHLTIVRFRHDGLLTDAAKLPRQHHEALVTHLKQRATTVNHAGSSFSHPTADQPVLIHFTSLQLMDGEKVVLHLVPHLKRPLDLPSLGFWGPGQRALEHALSEPHGVIVSASLDRQVTSKTLAALGALVQSVQRSVLNIEPDSAQTIDGINHMQMTGRQITTDHLLAALRQDSDVIIMGNLIDHDAGELAFEAGMTNRLLLGSMYAASGEHVLRRLLDMHLAPHLVAAGLKAVTGQRRVKKLCAHCRTPYKPSPTVVKRAAKNCGLAPEAFVSRVNQLEGEAIAFGLGSDIADASSSPTGLNRLWKASKVGCQACHFSGYQGQIFLAEVIALTPPIQRAVIMNRPIADLRQTAQADSVSIDLDHVIKALRGLTELEQISKRS
ncbi:MAG: Type secretion system protein [Candidatus Saccharibacteria bacterium]|nr:Type secretion system protein [Candidatus Saccharibacteria bacterium]